MNNNNAAKCDSRQDNKSDEQCNQIMKPPVAKKPVLDRTVTTSVLSPRGQTRAVRRSVSVASPSRMRHVEGVRRIGGEEESRAVVMRRAAPPPPLRR